MESQISGNERHFVQTCLIIAARGRQEKWPNYDNPVLSCGICFNQGVEFMEATEQGEHSFYWWKGFSFFLLQLCLEKHQLSKGDLMSIDANIQHLDQLFFSIISTISIVSKFSVREWVCLSDLFCIAHLNCANNFAFIWYQTQSRKWALYWSWWGHMCREYWL